MKRLLFLIAVVLLSVGCSKKPDDVIHNTKTEEAGWVVKEKGQKPEQSYEEYYQISPTWGQAFHYVNGRKDRGFTRTAGILFLIAFVAVFYLKATDSKYLPKFLDTSVGGGFALFVLVVAGFFFLIGDASSVKWNNDKWVKKEVYDKAIKESGSTQPIWDSLENNCLIVDGSYNCK